MEHSASNETQVVIVGAGPTGLTMAAQLMRYQIDFILIEKNEKTTKLSKAIAIQARTLEIFQEIGIVERAITAGQITSGMNLFYKGKRKASIDLSGLGQGQSHYTMALSLEQSKTEQLLVDYLNENGKQVCWKSEFSHFQQNEDGVNVYYINEQGIEQQINASYLVGCDGAASPIRHQLGLSFEGSTKPKLFYVADTVLTSPVINQNILYMHMIPKGFVLFFPMEGIGHYRLIGVLPDYKNNDTEYQFSDIEADIKQQIITPVDFRALNWFSTYKVHSRKANSFMKGRCFIAGDAAHIHTPAGGQGMNTGIQDAYNLAWKMAYRIRNEVNEKVLASYNSERTQNARNLLHTTDRMFDIMSGVNSFWNTIRLAFFPGFLNLLTRNKFVNQKIFPLISQTGITYPESLLTIKSSIAKVKAGDRMHYFVFSNGRQIFSYLTNPEFKLLYFGNNNIQNPLENVRIKMSFICFNEIPESIFGNAREFYILMRPDNHISYIGKDIDKCRVLINNITLAK